MKVKSILLINDHEKVEGVYGETKIYLDKHVNIYEKLTNYYHVYHTIGDLIPQDLFKMFSGHNFPYVASFYELENSIELCMQGFYRYSFFALRSVLELGILGIFFDRDNQSHIEVKPWLKSEIPTPKFGECLNEIFEIDKFRDYDSNFAIKDELKKLYYVLSDYVHSRGHQYSTIGQTKANCNTFQEKVLLEYITYVVQVVRLIVILMLILYPVGMQFLPIHEKFGSNPPAGGFLFPGGHQIVMQILPENIRTYLQNFSNKDEGVNAFVEWINSRPDVPEDEIDDPATFLAKLAEAKLFRDFHLRSPEEDEKMKELEEKLKSLYRKPDKTS